MRLDIELSEAEIRVIRIALEAKYQYDAAHGLEYKDGRHETLYDLRLRFHDLAQVKTPTP